MYTVGHTGIPIINVNNNCATGSTALYMARNAIIGGLGECVLALGFEKMFTGSLKTFFKDRSDPIDEFLRVNEEQNGLTKDPINTQLCGNAGREHMKKYGSTAEHFAKIAEKNHRHSANNPYS